MGPVRIALAIAVAVAVATAVTACSGPATSVRSHVKTVPATYYLALGDSLSQGVQPDAAGTSVETRQGYPDQLYAMLHPGQ
ncbi:MAG TPA: SGNH/GDSL hydrolase family protein, partial [Streptosporangiaceae bacterium]|nr:SGNH/GDSL hydrolase family protein [Streptosporangiaceae bacterium]